jgi:hypothetical protein
MQTQKDTLQAELHNLPQTWKLTPLGKKDSSGEVNPKAPYLTDWSSTNVDREFINSEIESGIAKGYGLRTGEASGRLLTLYPFRGLKFMQNGDVPVSANPC